jgi:hypothetical protein
MARTTAELNLFGMRRWRSRQSSPERTCALPVHQRRPIRTRTRGSAWMFLT